MACMRECARHGYCASHLHSACTHAAQPLSSLLLRRACRFGCCLMRCDVPVDRGGDTLEVPLKHRCRGGVAQLREEAAETAERRTQTELHAAADLADSF